MLLFEIYVEIKIKKINPSPRTLLYIRHVTILTVLTKVKFYLRRKLNPYCVVKYF